MIPLNTRKGDFVTVSNKGHAYFGSIGKVSEILSEVATVDIYGKLISINMEDLTLKARTGTNSHDSLLIQVKERECNHLGKEGYNNLIDFAIDNKDFEWANELIERRDRG